MSYFYYKTHRIYYEEAGTGAPLLLLHGNAASSMMFYEIAPRYQAQFHVIQLDFLGHGQSDRLREFPTDLWYEQAQQVIAFLREKSYGKAHLIGSSGGALVAINVALEAPELVAKVIADSFEGEVPLKEFTANLIQDRANSKQDEGTRQFYQYMQGEDWESVVDNDTAAIVRHQKEIGRFFHRELDALQPDILLTGSREDEFVSSLSPDYFDTVYGAILQKIGHGSMRLFDTGGHPAILSNANAFYECSLQFLQE